jgi:hypothetical protein
MAPLLPHTFFPGGIMAEKDFSPIEAVLKAAVPHVASQSGVSFSRTIQVSDEAGGDIRVKPTTVVVHPRFATEGDPLTTCKKIITTCVAFDNRAEEEELRVKQEAYASLERAVKVLKRKYPFDDVPEIVEQMWNGS